MVSAWGWEEGKIMGYYLMGIDFRFKKDEKVLAMDGGDDYTTVWILHLKMVKRVKSILCIFYHNKKKTLEHVHIQLWNIESFSFKSRTRQGCSLTIAFSIELNV